MTGSRAGAGAADVTMFFGRVEPDDLARLSRQVLEHLAQEAREHLAARRPGKPSIRIFDVPEAGITVVEAINDNMPFLFSSTLAELGERGLDVQLVAHPIIRVERDGQGRLTRLSGEASGAEHAGEIRESFIHIHVARLPDAAARQALKVALEGVYDDVEHAVDDWQPMRARLAAVIQRYRDDPPPLPKPETQEAIALLEWLRNDNFTLLGMRDYRFSEGVEAADPRDGTGLGIMRDPEMRVLRRGTALVTITPEVRRFLAEPVALIIVKANVKSRVHRRVHLDYVGVKLFDADGALEGELRIVGLFTSSAYTGGTRAIPYLRRKVATVLQQAGLDPESHSGRALQHILEDYPRDELFQVDPETLRLAALDILALEERPRIRVLARLDSFDRFVSVLVYIPKERYDTDIRRKVGAYLAEIYQGRLSASYPYYPEGLLARTHFIIGRDGEPTPHIPRETLEAGVTTIVRTWGDSLRDALAAGRDGAGTAALHGRFADAFSAAYREAFTPADAIADITIIDRLDAGRLRAVAIYRKAGDPPHRASLKVYAHGEPMLLSDRVPLLEHMGFVVVNERTYAIAPAGAQATVWLHDMTLERPGAAAIDIAALEPKLEALLMALFRGDAESDGYNALVVEQGLDWREVALLRAYSRYARQIRVSYSHEYMAATLVKHSALAAQLVALFTERFDPAIADAKQRARKEQAIRARIEAALAAVAVLDEDRILRQFIAMIEASVRSNFFQRDEDGEARKLISFKLEPRKVPGMPLPAPLYEIFLDSPRVQGLHLRAGKVARGGIRWSDRPEDFRTEVLSLVKAQHVKNAVIVPVGAKGGFIPKKLPPASERAAWLAEGTESYRLFVRTMLELTDNLDGDTLVPVADTVRHDGDDPYFVVAADKGTATFSDVANALSLARGFWLGDAFASGGSVGYDHKGLGITAKGAWEGVKRHFRERDIDIQTVPFTVAGVGDMSGDVFGNGMLLSPCIRLQAAFDHRDIFLDPEPDPAPALAERARLFKLPRSSWQDYDKSLISAGGGIFPRSAKAIPLSAPLRAMLDLDQAEATPQEVMTAILKMRVDLLWFGGIGTYIRASDESDTEAGDRANDAIRITGSAVRATVIGEGANLGMTQRGRIEAGRNGVALNTDAIDNSAGVNCSDVEVNIKIAIATPYRDGRLSEAERAPFLASMTEDVGRLVPRNNYMQTLAISLCQRRGAEETGYLGRLMQVLESEGRLDRKVEFLPDAQNLAQRERAGESLTRSEIAVLLAYAKLTLYDDLLESRAPDEPYFYHELDRYFPDAIRERFPDAIASHKLRREIIATGLANAIINRGGPSAARRVRDRTGCDIAMLAHAYAAARDSFGLYAIHDALDGLDNTLAGQRQLALYGQLQVLLLGQMVWFVRNLPADAPLEETIRHYADGIDAVAALFDGDDLPLADELTGLGMPAAPARRLALIDRLVAAPAIVRIADQIGKPVAAVAGAYFGLDGVLSLGILVEQGRAIATTDHYEQLALERAIDGIAAAHDLLAIDVMRATGGALEPWAEQRGPEIERSRAAIAEISREGLTVAKLTVAAGLLGDLARG